ncbi:hypothetical protein CR205_04365 [Alteribacter lacisalsi]|uniref:GAF domain-containing protein n=1 Tax=Alteribacter lacisalsi TaxID=2045244 RepID=A0A2W0H7L2_9BACI|nr:hypothetical protein [Alteribacter lacisalsi]PYZ97834.1 hypothetical protein CR205_04365 [Alteribacter lacisalsi]
MNKSDLLDELRMEVGLAYDYARDLDDFIGRVGRALFEGAWRNVTISIYLVEDETRIIPVHFFGNVMSLGNSGGFGEGWLKVCSRARPVVLKREKNQTILLPVREGGKVRHILSMQISSNVYVLTEQDLFFVEELVSFIEAKGKLL